MHSLPFEVYKDSPPEILSTIGQIRKILGTAGPISLYKQNISGEVASAQTVHLQHFLQDCIHVACDYGLEQPGYLPLIQ